MNDDPKREKPVVERLRQWAHGDAGMKDCPRKDTPIFTPPEKLPDPCRNWMCGGDEWRSQGIVLRDKKNKQVVHREPV